MGKIANLPQMKKGKIGLNLLRSARIFGTLDTVGRKNDWDFFI